MTKNLFNRMVWSPLEYSQAAVLAREVGEEMLSRLDWMTVKPQFIVEMGCGTGESLSRLQARYPDANVLALDLSLPMIQQASQSIEAGQSDAARVACICADAAALPLADQSIDLIYANLLLPWHPDVKALLQEWRRVLRPNGLIMLTLLGLDTLKEFHNALNHQDMPDLVDMHDVGDFLVAAGFSDPVLDVDRYTLLYRDQQQLVNELRASGMLAKDAKIDELQPVSVTEDGRLPVTYEAIFAHAFMPENADTVSPSADGVVRIPLKQLRRQLMSG